MIKDILQQSKDALDKALAEKKRNEEVMKNLGPAIVDSIRPVLDENNRIMKQGLSDLAQSVSELKINVPKIEVPKADVQVNIPEIKVPEPRVTVNIPEIKIPEIASPKIPTIKVPKPEVTVNVPPIKIPDLKWPEEKMPIEGWVQLMGVSLNNPLPVQLRDASGKPVDLSGGTTQVFGGGGGKHDHFTIKGFGQSAFSEIMNSDGEVKVAGTFTAGAAASSFVIPGNSEGVVYNGDNPLPVVITSGAGGSTASALIDSGGVQYSGSNPVPITWVSGAGVSTAVHITDSGGIGYSGSNPVPVTGTVVVSSVTNSTAASLIDSGGVGYSGSNPLPITGNVNVNGSLNSVLATGVTLHDAVDTGEAPIKIGGTAMQTNPTAVADGDRVRFTADDLGRQLIRPVQVRDLLATAYVTLTNGDETTLLSAVTGSYFDLIYVMGANASDVAAKVSIRPITGGNITHTFIFPTGTQGFVLPVPYPQAGTGDGTGNNWTVDMDDITGTTVYVSALFSKEI